MDCSFARQINRMQCAGRHNRELKGLFPHPHPPILNFIEAIEKLSREKARILEDIRKGKAKALVHNVFVTPETPMAHTSFRPTIVEV